MTTNIFIIHESVFLLYETMYNKNIYSLLYKKNVYTDTLLLKMYNLLSSDIL